MGKSDISALLRQGPMSGQTDTDQALMRDLVLDRVFEPESSEPKRMGRYGIVRHLGSGGMGSVWVARDDRLGREVAIKLLRGSSKDERTAARLAREGQALAALSHPNVVQVYGTGRHDGHVYMVMELVSGQSLAEWLREPRTWPQVLEVMIQVARGLAAAHEAGIVHRDLKPANIVIDEEGRARLIDFGIARVTGEVPTGEHESSPTDENPRIVTLTRTGVVMGTPFYMAPEQLRGTVGPATDQFAFCVTLFEAVYGARPFRGDDYEELATAIIKGPRPDPVEGRDVPPWLHRVIVRGLAVDPDDRWPSMLELVDRLSRGGRARTKGARWLLAGVLATAGIAVAVHSARDAGESPGAAAETDTTEPGDPEALALLERGRELWRTETTTETAKVADQVVARAVAAGDRPTEAAGRLLRGKVWTDQERFEEADGELRRAHTLAKELGRADLELDATLAVVRVLTRSDRFEEATTWMRHAEAAWERSDRSPRSRVGLLRRQALLFRDIGELDDAYATAKEALATAEPLGEPGLVDGLQTDLADIARKRGDNEIALEHYRRALANQEARLGPDHRDVGNTLTNLGATERLVGQLDEARAHQERALAILVATHGEHHTAVADVHTNLGLVASDQRDVARAREHYERALEILVDVHGGDDAKSAVVWVNLGAVEYLDGDIEAAIRASKRALVGMERDLGEGHPDTATVLANLGVFAYMQGRLEEAMDTMLRARTVLESSEGVNPMRIGELDANMGLIALEHEDFERARQLLRRSREIFAQEQGATHPRVATVSYDLCVIELEDRRYDAAKAECERARQVHAAHPDPVGEANVETAEARRALGEGRTAEGLRRFREAIAVLDRELGAEHRDLFSPLVNYGRALVRAGRNTAADEVLARAHAIATAEQDDRHLLESGLWLARARWRLGRREDAVEAFTAAAALVDDDEAFTAEAGAWKSEPRSSPPMPESFESAPP